MPADTVDVWSSRFLDVAPREDALSISYRRSLKERFGLRMRERELCHRIRVRLKRLGRLERTEHGYMLTIPAETAVTMPSVLASLDGIVESIATRPFSSHQVEESLGISAQERLRWTKDGRLPSSGTATMRKGQTVTLSTYSVNTVAMLVSNPSVIAAWRVADAARLSEA